MRLNIQSRIVGEVLVVNCGGRIVGGEEVESLHTRLRKALAETADVVLHLGDVTFIDSSGIGCIVRLMTYARSRGGDLKLCAVPEMISRTLRMTNLHKIFEIYASEAEAIAATYQRRPARPADAALPARTVLFFEESADVLAYVRELLHHAGYRVLTTSMLADAQVLLKATRPHLIMLGPRVVTVRERNTQELFAQIAPAVPLFVLDSDFSTRDPGEAGTMLLEKVRGFFPA